MSDGPVEEVNVKLTGESSGMAGAFAKALIGVELLKVGLEKLKAITIDIVKEQYKQIDELGKLSDRLGISVKSVQELKYAGELADVSLDSLTQGITKMQKSLEAAKDPGSDAAQALNDIGVSLDDLKGKNAEERLGIIADGLNTLKDNGERTTATMVLLGKSGNNLFNLLKEGSAGIHEAAEEFDRMGGAMSRVDAAKVEMANDALKKLHTILEIIGQKIAITTAPFITAIAEELQKAGESADGFQSQVEKAVEICIEGAKYVANGWRAVQIAFAASKVAVAYLAEGIYKVADVGLTAFNFLKNVITNWKDVAIAAWDNMKASFSLLVGYMKNAFGEFSVWINDKYASMLEGLAEGLSYVSQSAADAINEVAGQMREGSSIFSEAMKEDMKKAEDEAAASGERLKALFNAKLKPEKNEYLEQMVSNSAALVEQYKADLDEILNAPLPSDSIQEWADRVRAIIQKIAEEKAAAMDKFQTQEGEDPEVIAARENARKVLDIYEDKTTKLRGKEADDYKERQDEMQKRFEEAGATQGERDAAMEQLQAEHEAKLAEIDDSWNAHREKANKATWKDNVETTKNSLANLATLMNTHNRKAFEAGKVAAIANALIATAQGAAQALRDVPYPLNLLAAASVVAAGAVQISAIKSTSFGGGGGAASHGGGAPHLPSPHGSTLGNGVRGNTSHTTIHLEGSSYTQDDIRNLIERINEAQTDGTKIKVVA